MSCPDPSSNLGVIESVLGTVDCHVRGYSEAGYHALTGPQSFFPTALTLMLTLYVGLLGLRLMFGIGSARLLDAPVIALKIGAILALTLNWTTFQTLVFDLAMKAPVEVAQTVAGPALRSGSALAASPLAGLQSAYDELGLDATAFGKAAGPDPQVLHGGQAMAADGLWKAQTALFMGTAGLIAMSIIATGVLAAVGPVFIALFLFQETRGLFAGWLRAILASALTPMLCWITTAVMLVAIEPWLAALQKSREAGDLDLQTAMTVSAVVFIFALAQAALAFGATAIASGLQIGGAGRRRGASAPPRVPAAAAVMLSRPERLAMQLQHSAAVRRISFAAAAPPAASASAGAGGGGRGGVVLPFPAAPRPADAYRRESVIDRLRGRSLR